MVCIPKIAGHPPRWRGGGILSVQHRPKWLEKLAQAQFPEAPYKGPCSPEGAALAPPPPIHWLHLIPSFCFCFFFFFKLSHAKEITSSGRAEVGHYRARPAVFSSNVKVTAWQCGPALILLSEWERTQVTWSGSGWAILKPSLDSDKNANNEL